MNNEKVTVCGMFASTLLGVAFIILKLCGVIQSSWWWVLAPFWIPFVFIVCFIAMADP